MRTVDAELPSGMILTLTQLKMSEESILADASKAPKAKQTKVLLDILDRCCDGIVERGPYPGDGDSTKVPWKDMIVGDRVKALIELNLVSYSNGGKMFVPEVKCQCKEEFSWEIDLKKDLTEYPLPEESREKIKAGKPFECVINEHKIHFVIETAKTEELLVKLKKQHRGRIMAAGLRSRIVDVIKPNGEAIHRSEIVDFLDGEGSKNKYDGLTAEEAEYLRDEMEKVDGGIDLEVTATCPDCGAPVRFDLPFQHLFLPSRGIHERRIDRRGKG